ncbi:MAG: hypothetical protein ABW250_02420 [Pyrinomonadaceae bacterium]
MMKPPDYEPSILPLFLKDIFPLCNLSLPGKNYDKVINAAYRQLFEELIPDFKKDVHFVLAEVLELDKEKSQPRLLVYSNRNRAGVKDLLEEYFAVIKSLREDEWSISKADALYTGSRIWCAEMQSADCPLRHDRKKWVYEKKGDFPRGYEFDDEADEAKEQRELEEIRVAFKKYTQALYDLQLKNYPFAYVMLIPIFLGSMYGKQSRMKLGAIFLHFATSRRVEQQALRRIFGRTLLFWHYYFTSEALDKRKEMFNQSRREFEQSRLEKETLEKSVALLNKIKPFIDNIGHSLRELQRPLFHLEAELKPAEVVILGGDQSKFFQTGPRVYILNGQQEITPRHDWADDAVDTYKTLVAGVLVNAFRLDGEVKPSARADLWARVSRVVTAKAEDPSDRLFKELTHVIPHLRVGNPTPEQVKETFKIVKSWYSDAFKPEGGPGMPLSMLEFAFRTWGSEFKKDEVEPRTFWVASEFPARTIDALGILHEERRFKEVSVSVSKERGGSGKALTCCEARIKLGEPGRPGGHLRHLWRSLDCSLKSRAQPRGNMTTFLWVLCGGRPLSLSGTVFSWRDGSHEVSVDFRDPRGRANEMVINWKGEIRV